MTKPRSSLLDDIRGQAKPRGTGTCPIGRLLESLAADETVDLLVALEDTTLPGAAITRALVDRGHAVSRGSVSSHRRGDCSCVSAS